MKKKLLGAFFFVLLILQSNGLAQTSTPTPTPRPSPHAAIRPKAKTAIAYASPSPIEVDKPSPIRISWEGEYLGNRLGQNFGSAIQPDNTVIPAELDHDFRMGYALTDHVTVGLRTTFENFFSGPTAFNFDDLRAYVSYGKLVDTSDVQIDGKFETNFPTSVGSQTAGQIIRFNLSANVTLKTPLRNWMFSAVFYVSPRFFQNPGPTSVVMDWQIDPLITVDIAPHFQIGFYGNFEADQIYGNSFFGWSQLTPNYINVGPIWIVNNHLQIWPALRFWTANFGAPNLDLDIQMAL